MNRFALFSILSLVLITATVISSEAADKKKKPEATADLQKLFKTLDANSDNKLSLEEYKNLAVHLPKPKTTKKNKDKAPSPPDFEGTFKTLDKNSDKFLVFSEFEKVGTLIPLSETNPKK